jgi:hypothetical protein
MGGKRHKERPQASAQAHVNPERLDAGRKRRQRLLLTWSFVIVAALLVGLVAYSLVPKPSPYVGFAQCLAQKGAVMYGTDWCGHCQDQKRMFGTAFKGVVFVNCDYSRACLDNNVTGYPTWILADGTRLEGEQPLGLLAEKTGCTLPRTS